MYPILIFPAQVLGRQHSDQDHNRFYSGEFQSKNKEEFNADVFAAHLLLPAGGVKSLIPDEELGKDRIKLATILKIEQYFSCSRPALLYRLKNLGITSSARQDELGKNVTRSAVEFGYRTNLYRPGNHHEVIGDYGSLARALFEREVISESHYYSLLTDLGMDVREIEALDNATG